MLIDLLKRLLGWSERRLVSVEVISIREIYVDTPFDPSRTVMEYTVKTKDGSRGVYSCSDSSEDRAPPLIEGKTYWAVCRFHNKKPGVWVEEFILSYPSG